MKSLVVNVIHGRDIDITTAVFVGGWFWDIDCPVGRQFRLRGEGIAYLTEIGRMMGSRGAYFQLLRTTK